MKSRRTAISSSVISVIVIVLLVAAGGVGYFAGTSSTSTTTVIGGTGGTTVTMTTTAAAQMESLIAASKAEGNTLNVYGVTDAGDFNSIIAPAFMKAFPWITTINYQGLSVADIYNKISAEYKAGQVHADVIYSTYITTVASLKSIGAVQPFSDLITNTMPMMGYATNTYDPAGYWSTVYVYANVLVYNTHTVTDTSTLPKTWVQAFTDPQWKGQFAYLDPKDMGPSAGYLASIGTNMTNSQWISFLQAAYANNPVITASDGTSCTDLTSGEVSLAVCGVADAATALAKGAPVAIDWLSPTWAQRDVMALPTGSPHIATAELFLMWSEMFAGQMALAATGRTPISTSAAAATPGMLPIQTPIFMTDTASFNANQTYYSGIFNQYFGG